jgi:hypothetical protein
MPGHVDGIKNIISIAMNRLIGHNSVIVFGAGKIRRGRGSDQTQLDER